MLTMIKSLIRHHRLAYEMAVWELRISTKGSFLGLLWIVLRPLLQVATYVFIITVIFNVRLGPGTGTFDYAITILGGLVPWLLLSRSFEESPELIRSRITLMKQVAYPIETLPLTMLMVNAVGPVVGFAVYFLLSLFNGTFTWTWVLLPLPLVLLATFLLGMSWVFMLVGVVFKDLKDIFSIVLAILIFLSPVLITETNASPLVWGIIQANPISHFIIPFRDVFEGTFHSWSWLSAIVMAAFAMWLGGGLINKAKLKIREYA